MTHTIMLTLALFLPAGSALGQQQVTIQTDGRPVQCTDLQKNPNGAWTPLKQVTISNGSGCTTRIGAGKMAFKPGMATFCGVDVGSMLDKQCGDR
jgi:hypothetical protein